MAIGKHGHVTVPCGFIHANLPTRQCAFGRLHVITIFYFKNIYSSKVKACSKKPMCSWKQNRCVGCVNLRDEVQ